MRCIKFCEEVMLINEGVTFWVENRGDEYATPYCVNMSVLEKQNMIGEASIDSIIRSEAYETNEEAYSRLEGIYLMLKA